MVLMQIDVSEETNRMIEKGMKIKGMKSKKDYANAALYSYSYHLNQTTITGVKE